MDKRIKKTFPLIYSQESQFKVMAGVSITSGRMPLSGKCKLKESRVFITLLLC